MLKGFVSGEEKDIKRIPMKGKNLYNGTLERGSINIYGVNADNDTRLRSNYVNAQANTTYFMSYSETRFQFGVRFYNNGFIDYTPSWLDSGDNFTTPSNCTKIRFLFKFDDVTTVDPDDITKIMLNLGSTPLPYEPYGYQEGWEVRDSQDRLIWGREDELQTATGTLPFKGYALPVKVKSLLGNAVQNGTPSPQNIVTLEMCGVRTGNLVNESKVTQNAYMSDQGIIGSSTVSNITDYIDINASPFVISGVKTTDLMNSDTRGICFFDSNKEFIRGNSYSPNVMSSPVSFSNIPSNAKYVRFTFDKAFENGIMLNLGSTALPYEPYGWKILFENHGENLWDEKYPNISGTIQYIPLYVGDGSFTLSTTTPYDSRVANVFLLSGNVSSGASTAGNGAWLNHNVTAQSYSGYITIAYRKYTNTTSPADCKTMLSLGSTPKPYSPYLNATIPVYLGEVPTVRRIVKEEILPDRIVGYEDRTDFVIVKTRIVALKTAENKLNYLCSHFKVRGTDVSFTAGVLNNNYNNYYNMEFGLPTTITSLDDAKAWFNSQKAAGHPVTVWYVIANEQTGISNEPLCKISTYADELTTIQVHGLSAPLYGIGDYKDTLNLSTGVVTRKVKKLVLTGTEQGWVTGQAGGGAIRFRLPLSDITIQADTQRPTSKCTHFPLGVEGGTWNYDNVYTISYANDTWNLWLRVANISTLNNLQQFLRDEYAAGHPVTIWYVLSTPTTETVTVPAGMTGEIEGYLTQVSTPTPTNRSVPKWNGVEETGGTYAVTVYTPPEIPTTTGQNTLTVDTDLEPSNLTVKGHIKTIQ